MLNVYKMFGLRKQPKSENPKGSFDIPYTDANPTERYRQDVEDMADFTSAPKFHSLLDTFTKPPSYNTRRELSEYAEKHGLESIDLGELNRTGKMGEHWENILSIFRSGGLRDRDPETGRRKYGRGEGGPEWGSALSDAFRGKPEEGWPKDLEWPGVNYPRQEDLEAIKYGYQDESAGTIPLSTTEESKEPYNAREIYDKYFFPSGAGENLLTFVLKPELLAESFEDWIWSTDVIPELKSDYGTKTDAMMEELWDIFKNDHDLEELPDETLEEALEHLHASGEDEAWVLPEVDIEELVRGLEASEKDRYNTWNETDADFEVNTWWDQRILPHFIMGRNPPKYIRDLLRRLMDVSPNFKRTLEADGIDDLDWWNPYNRKKYRDSLDKMLRKAFGL